MNRKQKIIVSVTGIFLVLLILMGLTYAYFLTQIKGNTKQQSISVTTADLELTYHDGNGKLNVGGKLLPGNDVEFLTTDGTLTKEKTFSVENTGDSIVDSYAVILEDLKVYYATTFENEIQGSATYFEFPETLTYTLTCESNIKGNNCFGKNNEQFPTTEDILTTNSIEKDEIQTYTLTMYYANADYDQSNDMNKSLDAKINIIDTKGTADIKGTVTDSSEGDTVLVNLETDVAYQENESNIKNLSNTNESTDIKLLADSDTSKTAYLNKNGEYKVVGLPTGDYTVTVQDATESLTIQKGETAHVDTTNKIATVTDTSRVVTVDLDVTNKSASLSDKVASTPKRFFQHLIEDAKKAASENSETRAILDTETPAEFTGPTPYVYADGQSKEKPRGYNKYDLPAPNAYYTFADSYTYDKDTKKYSLVNSDGSDISYVKGLDSVVGKYVTYYRGSSTEGVAKYTELSDIYYIIDYAEGYEYYINLSNYYKNNYITYGDTYTFDSSTGYYTIKNKDGSALKTLVYGDNVEVLKNKYVVNIYGSSSSSVASTKNLTTIYKITDNSTEDIPKYVQLSRYHNSTEKRMLLAEDDYGTSYYYRGGVKNNYVNFAGFTWRIVRVNGDNSIRLILDGTLEKVRKDGILVKNNTNLKAIDSDAIIQYNKDSKDNAYVGYMYGIPGSSNYDATHKNINSSTTKRYIDGFYEEYIKDYEIYLSDSLFCGDKTLSTTKIGSDDTGLGYGTNITYYAATERLREDSEGNHLTVAKPTLECAKGANNTYSRYTSVIDANTKTSKGVEVNNDLLHPIALLSADELVMAGAFVWSDNQSYYLYDAYVDGNLRYMWRTMTPAYFKSSAYLHGTEIGNAYASLQTPQSVAYNDHGMRPVINLRADILYSSGDGTSTSPYTVELPE